MSHLDPDQLALIAVGEPVATPEEREHLASCADCGTSLVELRRAVRIARTTLEDARLESPPERVWQSIQSEIGLAEHPASPPAAADEIASARSRHPRRRRRRRLAWVMAAAVAVVAGLGVGVWAILLGLAPVSVATATLDSFPAHAGASGSADVEVARDGSRTLVVSLDAAALPDTYREVWLIRGDAAALISLGVLSGDRGSFPIPAGVDLDEYRLVDVSVEPIDGDPAHSGDSIVRGALTAT